MKMKNLSAEGIQLYLLIKSQLLCQLSYAPKPLFSINYDRCHFVKSGIVS